ncbi:CPBP family intramembrane metalloprotease [Patescibacteria group bacterium]|nr:CPBP family intramembrane metalloprotease [Patescibacteria group bacterium]
MGLKAITATLMEELLFRGPLYIMVFLRFPWLILILATIVDGVLFGYTHFRETLSLRDFCFKLGVGVFLSWLVIESGSLIPSISCHLFPNLIWMTLFRWADKNSS